MAEFSGIYSHGREWTPRHGGMWIASKGAATAWREQPKRRCSSEVTDKKTGLQRKCRGWAKKGSD